MTTFDSDWPDQAIAEVARSQFGAFSRRQAHEAGFTRHQVGHRLGTGRWTALHPGVFRIAGAPDSRALAATAGLLYAGDRAWFSHVTSARLHGIDPC